MIDGEILAWDTTRNRPLPFAALQKRIGRKTVPKNLLAEAPAWMLAYDLLEDAGQDIRDQPLANRRARLEAIIQTLPPGLPLTISPAITAPNWDTLATIRATARAEGAEGLMLKRRDSAYGVGRRGDDWWKWKVTPLTVDAVLVYAQAGHGRRAGLFTDYTFAVWDGDALVPFAKAYSGLTDVEIRAVDRFVRQNTLEKFGPVRGP